MKPYFHADLHIHGMAVFHRRLEAPLLHSFNGARIEPMSQAANDANVARMAFLVDDEPEHAGSLRLRVARFLGILRIGSRESLRRGDSSAHFVYAAANAASGAGA